jgi:hypothetical protein
MLRRRISPLNPEPRPPPRRTKNFFERLHRKLRIYLDRKPPSAYVDEYLATLRVAFRGEMVGTLAGALLAKKTLDTTRQVDVPFPDAYLDGTKPVDDAARVTLTAYAEALIKFHYELEEAENPIGMAVWRGLPTWIASCYCLADPALNDKGKEIWKLLTGSEGGIEEAIKLQMRRGPSDVERTYFSYRPAVFT